MNEKTSRKVLESEDCADRGRMEVWRNASALLATIDVTARDGLSVVVKIDGMREHGRAYTVVVSGPKLGERLFRQDGSDLIGLLQGAVAFLNEARNEH